MKAYIVNYTGHNFDGIYKLYPTAEIVTLSEGNVGIFNTHRLVYDFKLKMVDSGPEDVVVLTGSIILNIIASLVMFERHGHVNVLIWHAKRQEYVPRSIGGEDLT
jgi:hypothetical protein